ncbi:hypothetical protein C723_1467 [Christiangramia flava JLT2011]|uniref:Uncharacterized protein n=1 Tax=Christiangramia flava JLT2011 TaxID=1229726 RepID=A0A1L7I928_9FLAO|nr:hypothetical protein GRFL_3356 [Christiangramia flava JLT2011]OSS39565.1 hypothetical protein C723_1467 [Christiangramia flava JLT2011]
MLIFLGFELGLSKLAIKPEPDELKSYSNVRLGRDLTL